MKSKSCGLLISILVYQGKGLNNGNTSVCAPVRGNNPRAFASELSLAQADQHETEKLSEKQVYLCTACLHSFWQGHDNLNGTFYSMIQ